MAKIFQFLPLFLLSISTCDCNFTTRRLRTKLPISAEVSTCFDGQDTIYIMGGQSNEGKFFDEIYKYTVSRDTLQLIGHLPIPLYRGTCFVDEEEVYYFGGKDSTNQPSSKLYRFHTLSKERMTISLRTDIEISSLARTSIIHKRKDRTGNFVLFLSGDPKEGNVKILQLHINPAYPLKMVGELPTSMWGDTIATAFDGDEFVYIFGKDYSRTPEAYIIAQYSLKTRESSVIEDVKFPCDALLPAPSATWVEGIGALVFIGSGNDCASGILKYDPKLGKLTFIEVEKFPNETQGWDGTSTIYVKELNRIYIFGGYISPKYLDRIWYIPMIDQEDTGKKFNTEL